MNKVERAAGVSTKLSKNCTVTIKLQLIQVHELIWLYIDIKALMRKSTGQGLAMATGAWIQSSCLINGTACTYSKLSPLAVKLVAWLYDWAFIAHINPPSLWFLWNASDAYTPHRGRSVIALAAEILPRSVRPGEAAILIWEGAAPLRRNLLLLIFKTLVINGGFNS